MKLCDRCGKQMEETFGFWFLNRVNFVCQKCLAQTQPRLYWEWLKRFHPDRFTKELKGKS